MSLPIYFPPSGFSIDEALACGQHAITAYDQEAQWVAQGKPWNHDAFTWKPPVETGLTYSTPIWTSQWGPLHLVHENEPFGFVAWNDAGDTWIALRGTESPHDWLTDAEALHVTFDLVPGWGTVHRGFDTLYKSMRDSLMAALLQAPAPKRVFIAGHSLGSGVTTLVLADLANNTKLPLAKHYAYASPRVADPVFASRLNALPVPSFRIVNSEDLVPTLPLADFGDEKYEHIGTQVCFTAQYGSIEANHSMGGSYFYAMEHPGNPCSIARA
jgi:triacylglycerol lipase